MTGWFFYLYVLPITIVILPGGAALYLCLGPSSPGLTRGPSVA
jgi:hypothetical protein